MRTAILLLAASVLMVFAIVAKAATIENIDQKKYQLRIVESGQSHEVELLPGAKTVDLCKTKCELYIGADPDPYEFQSTDILVIEEGKLYDDSVDAIKPDPSNPKS